jgi:hypothetical protein
MKRLRRWLFASLATLSLLILAGAVGERVLTRSFNELWYFHTVRPINGGRGNSSEWWQVEFAANGVLLQHDWETDPGRTYASTRVLDDGQIHHESLPGYMLSVESCPETHNILSPDDWLLPTRFSVKGFGHDNLGIFFWHHVWLNASQRGFSVALPIWVFGGGSAIVLVLREMRRFFHRRITRKSNGCCSKCGYDLRATPDRCPECGTIPPKKKIPSS